jgi:phosphoadenosine phosphosulfate reductase
MLRRRALWDGIDEIVWADESDPESPGMRLSEEYGVEVAPFFIVDRDGKKEIYPSAIKVAKEVLSAKSGSMQATSTPDAASLTEAFVTSEARRLQEAAPEEILRSVLTRLGSRCAIAFSGAEDVALIDMAAKLGLEYSVFSLDTGRLHPETYRFIDTVRQFYGIEIQVLSPQSLAVEGLVRRKGLFSFYEDGHGECCGVRKLEPLKRALSGFDGWVTGQRRDQSPTRAEVPVLDWDTVHRPTGMIKANPLARLSQTDVWEYIRSNDVPYNELHDRGFISIGCEPCTRAIRPGEHERAARWWWEEATKRECGLHVSKDDSSK